MAKGIWGALGRKFFINWVFAFVCSSCFEKNGGTKKKNKAFLPYFFLFFGFGAKTNSHKPNTAYKFLKTKGKNGFFPKCL
ncbi:MAG: hypothetical protein Q9M46_04275 [Ghiorsea sp.]|nr:hypothetical protein [Ghiorsea sp.]